VSNQSDHLDHAQQITEQLRSAAEAAARLAAQPERDPRFDGSHCVEDDCGKLLPQVRIDAGRIRCVDCQNLIEQKRRFRR